MFGGYDEVSAIMQTAICCTLVNSHVPLELRYRCSWWCCFKVACRRLLALLLATLLSALSKKQYSSTVLYDSNYSVLADSVRSTVHLAFVPRDFDKQSTFTPSAFAFTSCDLLARTPVTLEV